MILGFISYPSNEEATIAAKYLVENDLVACAKILNGLTSFYKWEGKLEESSEVYLIIKSLKVKVDDLKQYLKSNHPYKVHEFIYSEIESGNEDYYKWVCDTLIKTNLK